MAENNTTKIRKLQTAIQSKGYKVLYNTEQFYSKQFDNFLTMHSVSLLTHNNDTDKDVKVQIFRTTSPLQIILLLRDIWFSINNWDLPEDNQKWCEIRKGLFIFSKGIKEVVESAK